MKQQVIVNAFYEATKKNLTLVRVRKPELYDEDQGREEEWDEWMHGLTIYYQTKRTLHYFLGLAFHQAIGLEDTEKLLNYSYKIDGWCKESCLMNCDQDPKTCTDGDDELFFSDETLGLSAIPFVEKWLSSIRSDKLRNEVK